MLAVDTVDDNNDIVMKSPREDFPSLNTIISQLVLKPVWQVY